MNQKKAHRPTTDFGASPAADAAVTASTIEQRVVALAEQLGRLVGTVQARTDGWIDREAIAQQLARIRDGATGLMGHLGGDTSTEAPRGKRKARSKPAARPAAKASAGKRSGGKVDAPGKAHRKAPAATRGVKHSNQTIAKLMAARPLGRARRG
jgi:hypothetical protein